MLIDDRPAGGTGEPAAVEPTPDVAREVFGARLGRATRYAARLASTGVEWGLLGPREPARIWSRHLLNCAVVADVIPAAVTVLDIGSGAGLPGIALAVARPDLRMILVEPLLRRAQFLTEVVTELGLDDQVRVVRGRAEEPEVRAEVEPAQVVTARALAPLDRVVRWCLPLVTPGGWLLAVKGRTAMAEVSDHGRAIARVGGVDVGIVECGVGVVTPPTVVVRVRRESRTNPPRRSPTKG